MSCSDDNTVVRQAVGTTEQVESKEHETRLAREADAGEAKALSCLSLICRWQMVCVWRGSRSTLLETPEEWVPKTAASKVGAMDRQEPDHSVRSSSFFSTGDIRWIQLHLDELCTVCIHGNPWAPTRCQ